MSHKFPASGILLPRQGGAAPVPFDPSLPNDSKAPLILGISGFMTGLAALIVLSRCYVRLMVLKVFGADDWIMLFAMACGIGVLACFVVETQNGLGRYNQYLIPENYAVLSKYSFYHSIVVMLGISAVKLSIGFFLLRVAQKSRYRKFIIGMIAFLVIFTLACAGTLIFQCLPVQAAWDFSLTPTAKCYSMDVFMSIGLFNSSINIVTDVIFATLPIPMFYNIKVNTRTKISLMGILSLGYLACTAAIVKTVQQAHVFETENVYRDNDFTLWNNIELQTGIMAGSLPALKPLFRAVLETTRNLSSGNTRSRPSAHNGYYYGTSGSNIAMNSFSGKHRSHRVGVSYLDTDSSSDMNGGAHGQQDKYNAHVSARRQGSVSVISTGEEEGPYIFGHDNNISPMMPARRGVFRRDSNSQGSILRTTEVYVSRDRERDRGRMRGRGDSDGLRTTTESTSRLRPGAGMENAI